jgi:predicted AAA+ superfamily ATPase
MIEVIAPYRSNLGKRLIKAPKIYVADSGIAAALLGLRTFEDILGHPGYGAMWEQIVLSNIRGNYPEAEIFYYRSSAGAEVDFVVSAGKDIFAVECKASLSPTLSKGVHFALNDIQPKHSFVVIPGREAWAMSEGIDVIPLDALRRAFL